MTDTQIVEWAVGSTLFVILFWTLFGYPHWRVWASHQRGLADLQQARNEQQIQIAKAQSRLDAAALNKQAAIIEAEAVAAQIQAIGDKLTTHDLYLRWQWIKMMEDTAGEHNTIYVPTEANIPILEATRLTEKATPSEKK
jgi:regulator of protease activity HflC (stomatin/prohibitin superfamily)